MVKKKCKSVSNNKFVFKEFKDFVLLGENIKKGKILKVKK